MLFQREQLTMIAVGRDPLGKDRPRGTAWPKLVTYQFLWRIMDMKIDDHFVFLLSEQILTKLLEISQIIPSPFDGGGCGWGWTKQRPFGPPSPSSPPTEGRGDFWEILQRKLEINSQTFWCQYLLLVGIIGLPFF
jgi:hypothetical protein